MSCFNYGKFPASITNYFPDVIERAGVEGALYIRIREVLGSNLG
jgi:hypothetical protein